MSQRKIENLSNLLKNHLGQTKIVTRYEATNLTSIGDNYGSLMLALKIHVQDSTTNQEEILEVAAKLQSESKFLAKMFNTPITFRNEINFYQCIIPELKKFLYESDVNETLDCFPDFYGARLNLTNTNDLVDDNAILLMENLKADGYETVSRFTGFDLLTSELALTNLAKLHAIPLAIKLKKFDKFQEIIKNYFQEYRIFDVDENFNRASIQKQLKVVESIDEVKLLLPNVQRALEMNLKITISQPKNSPVRIREPFATIIHTDTWVNNFMFKFQDHKPVRCKIVDFQLYEYGSPARDLLLFLSTSVQLPVAQQHFDNLIQIYYDKFIEILQAFGCDIRAFSFDAFLDELGTAVQNYSLFTCLMMLEPIFAKKEEIQDLEKFDEEEFKRFRPPNNRIKERVIFILNEFCKRKWI